MINLYKLLSILSLFLFATICNANQTSYPDNEDGEYEDMLTPNYYNSPGTSIFREQVNKFIYFARLTPFAHPLKNALGYTADYNVKRGFGDGIGPGNTSQHHNAFDIHLTENKTNPILYASISGIVNTYRDAPKYRDYMTITNDVKDSVGNILGKIVVIYGHIDLILDSLDNRNLDGKFINIGDTISTNLYSETKGGAHLHFEIRYYRLGDDSHQDFYNWKDSEPTTLASSGSWSYGYWNPNLGYGFAQPNNHLKYIATNINQYSKPNATINIYPNPADNILFIDLDDNMDKTMEILTTKGQVILTTTISKGTLTLDISEYSAGIYIVRIADEQFKFIKK